MYRNKSIYVKIFRALRRGEVLKLRLKPLLTKKFGQSSHCHRTTIFRNSETKQKLGTSIHPYPNLSTFQQDEGSHSNFCFSLSVLSNIRL